MNPAEELRQLTSTETFQNWKAKHEDSFLTHFFNRIDNKITEKDNWQLGFFSNDKMTVFVKSPEGFEQKPEDEIFRKPGDTVDELSVDSVKFGYPDAVKKVSEILPEYKEVGDGFVILQKINSETVWHFAFVTKSLQFVNVKVNATDGKVEHEAVNVVSR